jgi:hypothetical protein
MMALYQLDDLCLSLPRLSVASHSQVQGKGGVSPTNGLRRTAAKTTLPYYMAEVKLVKESVVVAPCRLPQCHNEIILSGSRDGVFAANVSWHLHLIVSMRLQSRCIKNDSELIP